MIENYSKILDVFIDHSIFPKSKTVNKIFMNEHDFDDCKAKQTSIMLIPNSQLASCLMLIPNSQFTVNFFGHTVIQPV